MIESDSINFGLSNIWKSWFQFRKGKKPTLELDKYQFNLEDNLKKLFLDLNSKVYKHGGYRKFIVADNKRREISVAPIRDRIVHRLVYDHLNPIYDKTFIFDAWSCRKGKGLIGAIERVQQFLRQNPEGYIWKADIKKFFDNVDHDILLKIILLKIKDTKTINLLSQIINNFSSKSGINKGMPIGNLTSQIFANIYLNELDRFIKYELKIKKYLRYGDDFIILSRDLDCLKMAKFKTTDFLKTSLSLEIHQKNNKIIKAKAGLKFLGVIIWPTLKQLSKRNLRRIRNRVNLQNLGSYYGILKQHGDRKLINELNWRMLGLVC